MGKIKCSKCGKDEYEMSYCETCGIDICDNCKSFCEIYGEVYCEPYCMPCTLDCKYKVTCGF